MNAGERDELLIKLKLVEMRDTGIRLNGIRINNVGFEHTEYLPIPPDTPENLGRLSDTDLSELTSRIGINKAGIFKKSDVYINKTGISLKSFSAAPPALVNHTVRPGFETACIHSKVDIRSLDRIIDNYWALRISGIITEDVRNSNPNCPFRNSKDVIKPVLEYFLFSGSGRGISKHPAAYILDYADPLNSNTWHILDPDSAVESVWEKLVFSLRAKKGMPKDYDINTYKKPNAASIARWVKYHSGDFRGALHIRVHR